MHGPGHPGGKQLTAQQHRHIVMLRICTPKPCTVVETRRAGLEAKGPRRSPSLVRANHSALARRYRIELPTRTPKLRDIIDRVAPHDNNTNQLQGAHSRQQQKQQPATPCSATKTCPLNARIRHSTAASLPSLSIGTSQGLDEHRHKAAYVANGSIGPARRTHRWG